MITDVTLACLRKCGRTAEPSQAARWRDLLRYIGVDKIEDLPDPGACTPVYCESAADCDPAELAALHGQSRPTDEFGGDLPYAPPRNLLRLFGLDDALLREDFRNFQARLRQSGLPLEPAFGNTFGCATALGLTWLTEGGEHLVCSFAGIGNLAPLEEIITALHLFEAREFPGLYLLPRARDLFTRLGGALCVPIGETKAVIGPLLFAVESGVHVDGLLKDAALYEAFAPELVGAARHILLGAHSGRSSVRLCCAAAGLPCGEGQDAELARAVRALSRERGRCLRGDEFFALYKQVCRESDASADSA
ncbi:MAG: hypothetical protein LBR82_01425 [Desulfovibrio sp.]|jgi:homocitrate synthase NifV|nr:hypothetical protein [Desulfovibrio sp.]